MTDSSRIWWRGLMAAIIGGAATAGGSWMAINAVGAAGAAVPVLNLKALGLILLVAGLTNLFNFLRQSPLPATSETTTVTVSKETVKENP